MSKRVFIVYLKTTGLIKLFEILKDFTIISSNARRRTKLSSTKEVLNHIGATFGSREDNYLVLNQNRKHSPLEYSKDEIMNGINKYNLKDVVVENLELISLKKINEELKEFWLKFESEFIKDDKIAKWFDEEDYNNDLMKLTRKRSILRLTMCCSKDDHISLPAGKRHYLVNLKPNWKDHDLEQTFIDEHIAYTIRDYIGRDWCEVFIFKETDKKGFVLDGIMK